MKTLAALLVLCSTAHAELLVEVTIEGWGENYSPCCLEPQRFGFGAHVNSTNVQVETYIDGPEDSGTVVYATPEQVAEINALASDEDNGGFGVAMFNYVSMGFVVDPTSEYTIWNPNLEGPANREVTVTHHVGPLGPGFTGYTLSDITLTVDSFEWKSNSPYLLAHGIATLRYFGDVGLVGDGNGDGVVDAADYVALREAGADLTAWRRNLGNAIFPQASLAAVSTPEPSCLMLLLHILFLGALQRRGR